MARGTGLFVIDPPVNRKVILTLKCFYNFLKFAVENHFENHTWLVANSSLTCCLGEKERIQAFGMQGT